MRHGAGILRWNTDELKSFDRRTRKSMTMHEALHPKSDVDRIYVSRKMCDKKSEAISHIVSECEKLAQKDYTRRHDNVARIVQWNLRGKSNLKKSEKWYEHAPEGVAENGEVNILWNVMIQCDREVNARKPEMVVVNKNGRSCAITDIAVSGDIKVSEKEKEKLTDTKN